MFKNWIAVPPALLTALYLWIAFRLDYLYYGFTLGNFTGRLVVAAFVFGIAWAAMYLLVDWWRGPNSAPENKPQSSSAPHRPAAQRSWDGSDVWSTLPLRIPLSIYLSGVTSQFLWAGQSDELGNRVALGFWFLVALWILPYLERRIPLVSKAIDWLTAIWGVALAVGISGYLQGSTIWMFFCVWCLAGLALVFDSWVKDSPSMRQDSLFRILEAPVTDALFHAVIGLLCGCVVRALFLYKKSFEMNEVYLVMIPAGFVIGFLVTLIVDPTRKLMSLTRRLVWAADGAVIGYFMIAPLAQSTGLRSVLVGAMIYGATAAISVGGAQSLIMARLPLHDRWSQLVQYAADQAIDVAGAGGPRQGPLAERALGSLRTATIILVLCSPIWLFILQAFAV